MRTVPLAWRAQTRPGGKILTTLGGWLYGYARVLLTVHADGTASGPLLPGTVSFMAARAHCAPVVGNPAHWARRHAGDGDLTRHSPERFAATTGESFFTRFLVQCAVPDAQLAPDGDTVHLIDANSGSAATLTPDGDAWRVRQSGPHRVWDQVEDVLDAYDAAGRPTAETFRLDLDSSGQHLRHPEMPLLTLPA